MNSFMISILDQTQKYKVGIKKKSQGFYNKLTPHSI